MLNPNSKVECINACMRRAQYHRFHLNSITREFVQLHGYEMSSTEASELRFVIVDGNDYEAAIRHILNMKCREAAAQEREAELQSEFLD